MAGPQRLHAVTAVTDGLQAFVALGAGVTALARKTISHTVPDEDIGLTPVSRTVGMVSLSSCPIPAASACWDTTRQVTIREAAMRTLAKCEFLSLRRVRLTAGIRRGRNRKTAGRMPASHPSVQQRAVDPQGCARRRGPSQWDNPKGSCRQIGRKEGGFGRDEKPRLL